MMRRLEEDSRRRMWLLGVTVLLLAMALELAVNVNLTLYSDDYWYGTFFQEGWRGFLHNTREHYQNTNGRVWVHILIPILLRFGTKLFALISPVLTALILLTGLRVQDRKLGGGALLLFSGLGLLSVLGSEIQYLRMTLYWLSAYFNYVFPLLFSLLTLWGMERVRQGRCSRLGFAALGLCALLAGASTEQCGVIALVVIGGDWLLQRGGESRGRRLWIFPLLSAVGYLTILTAPGSHARMERGIAGGIWSVLDPAVFRDRFFDVMSYLCGYGFWNVLFGALCLLLGAACWKDKALPRHLLSGFPAAALVSVLSAAGQGRALAVVTVGYTLYAAVTLILCPEYRRSGLLLLGGGASVMMLIVTTLYYARTFFPCVLLFLMVGWSLLARLLPQWPRLPAVLLCILLVGVSLVRYIPIYWGYAANGAVIEQNLQAIEDSRETGVLELNIDLEADYRFTMFFEGQYFLNNFLQYYHIPKETPVHFTSQRWDISDVRVGEQRSVFPALGENGEVLVPIEFLFQASGHPCQFWWTDYTFHLTWQGEEYTWYEDGRLVRHGEDGGEQVVDEHCEMVMPFSYTYTLLYVSADDLERCFGISLPYDPASDSYVFPEALIQTEE